MKNKRNRGKPGSDPKAAHDLGGKGDFGVPVNRTRECDYTSRNTKASDPGAAQPHAGELSRTAGVGGNESGVGSGSGGDIDTDIIGVGVEPLPADKGEVGGDKRINGRTVVPTDEAPGGADNANPLGGEDDAFAGEVSLHEAGGEGGGA